MSLREFEQLNFSHSARRLDRPSLYLIKKARHHPEGEGYKELQKCLESKTIYIGNLSHYTTEEQIFEIFHKLGPIERIIMGLDRFKYTPCGFCFVIFEDKASSINAVKYLNKTKIDGESISIDLDPGFEDGRQFGRGKFGGQKSTDDYQFMYQNMMPSTYTPGGTNAGGEDTYIPQV
ncbi:hypothetical protein ACO0QE_003517 [Hanseniaspora vineae]